MVYRGPVLAGLAGSYFFLRVHYPIFRRLVLILDSTAPPFSLTEPVYAEQLARASRVNVLQGGRWGCWRPLPLPPAPSAAVAASR